MHIPLIEAAAKLDDLVRRAEAGEEIVLTRDGQPVLRLMPVNPVLDRAERRALLDALREAGKKATPGPCAARSQDFLYDENCLPK